MYTRKKLWLLRAKYIKLHIIECIIDLNNASYLNNNFENILKSSRNKKLFSSFENYLDHTFLVKTVEDVSPTKMKALFLLFCIWALNWCIKYFGKQSIRESKLPGWFCSQKQFLACFCVVCQAHHTFGRYEATSFESVSWSWLMPLAATFTWQYTSEVFIIAINQWSEFRMHM